MALRVKLGKGGAPALAVGSLTSTHASKSRRCRLPRERGCGLPE